MGHSRGLGYLAFTEAWERFSYCGMQTLLVLYMVNRLLHPGHIERIAGFVIAERAPAPVRLLEQPRRLASCDLPFYSVFVRIAT